MPNSILIDHDDAVKSELSNKARVPAPQQGIFMTFFYPPLVCKADVKAQQGPYEQAADLVHEIFPGFAVAFGGIETWVGFKGFRPYQEAPEGQISPMSFPGR